MGYSLKCTRLNGGLRSSQLEDQSLRLGNDVTRVEHRVMETIVCAPITHWLLFPLIFCGL